MQKTDLVLQITSPPPFRPQGILLCTIALAILAFTVSNNADKLMRLTVGVAGTWAVVLVFAFLAGAVLFKNIFGKEELFLVRDGAPPGTAGATAIACGDLLAIERNPPPLPMTADYKMAMLGLGGETMTIFTSSASFPFGIGFSDGAATSAIRQMEQFCGRPLLRNAGAGQG